MSDDQTTETVELTEILGPRRRGLIYLVVIGVNTLSVLASGVALAVGAPVAAVTGIQGAVSAASAYLVAGLALGNLPKS